MLQHLATIVSFTVFDEIYLFLFMMSICLKILESPPTTITNGMAGHLNLLILTNYYLAKNKHYLVHKQLIIGLGVCYAYGSL
jgi:hypothetical protein